MELEFFTNAYVMGLLTGLNAVDGVLSFAKGGRGRPTEPEQALFVASVALSYAVWENYAEQLAIECATRLAQRIDPARVPDSVRDSVLETKPTAWDLSVHPGWRALWVRTVTAHALGSETDSRDSGVNTANTGGVTRLFRSVGVDAFADTSTDDTDRLDELVRVRGQIVHTGAPPDSFRKRDATNWRTFVSTLAVQVDHCVLRQVDELLA